MGELPTGFAVSTALNRLTHTPPGLPDDYGDDDDDDDDDNNNDDDYDNYDDHDDHDDYDYDTHARLPDDNKN